MPENNLADIQQKVDNLNLLIQENNKKIEDVDINLKKILFRQNFTFGLSLLYWFIIIIVAFGFYLYIKEIILYIFNNNPIMQNIFDNLELLYKTAAE